MDVKGTAVPQLHDKAFVLEDCCKEKERDRFVIGEGKTPYTETLLFYGNSHFTFLIGKTTATIQSLAGGAVRRRKTDKI